MYVSIRIAANNMYACMYIRTYICIRIAANEAASSHVLSQHCGDDVCVFTFVNKHATL